MLIIEQLKETTFSPAEQIIAKFLLDNPEKLENLTANDIALATHTNPTSLVRVAKKIGFRGWSDLKNSYLSEWKYLNSHFTTIDANLPFSKQDNLLTIANKIATLESNTIHDTLSLIDFSTLEHAKRLILDSKQIKLYASHSNSLIAQDFIIKLRRINIKAYDINIYQYGEIDAYHSDSDTCAILISYTGENKNLISVTKILKERKSKIISLTSIGDNTISKLSDCNFRITTRERLYSKIGNFTSNTSIVYILDLIYAIIFSANYDKNLNHLLQIGSRFDTRSTSISILQEKKDETL